MHNTEIMSGQNTYTTYKLKKKQDTYTFKSVFGQSHRKATVLGGQTLSQYYLQVWGISELWLFLLHYCSTDMLIGYAG